MTTRTDDSDSAPIESRDDLLATFAAGEKVPDRWSIGTEHEKFVYRTSDHRAPSYDEPGGIRDLLMGLTDFGWKPVVESGNVIALSGPDGTVSLEPAGQFELSRSRPPPRPGEGGRREAGDRLPRTWHVAGQDSK